MASVLGKTIFGPTGPTTLLISDVIIDKKSTMTCEEKNEFIKEYKEHQGFEIISPTTMICDHFGDNIGYCLPNPNIFGIVDNEIHQIMTRPNIHRFWSIEEAIDYLSDKKKRFYLSKATKTQHSHSRWAYEIHVVEIDNIPQLRDEALQSLGI